MNIDKLTTSTQEVLQKAQSIVQGNGQQVLEPSHLLKAIIENENSVIPFLAKEIKLDIEFLRVSYHYFRPLVYILFL